MEFGYETVDLLRLYYLYFTTKEMHTEQGKHLMLLWTAHHLPGIIVIIPANLYLSSDVYFQKIVCLLLTPTILLIPLHLISKTLDIKDLSERTQFTACYVFNIVIIVTTRLYYWNLFCWQYYFNSVQSFDLFLQIGCLFYYVALTYFNVDYCRMVLGRLYNYCFNVKTEKDMIKHTQTMQGDALDRRLRDIMQHAKVSVSIDDYNKHNKTHAKVTRLPFRRLSTEPQLKFE